MKTGMISLDEAEQIIDNLALPSTEYEDIDYMHALGRITAGDIYSDTDMPPFDKSAMDGYACKLADIHQPLKVMEIIPAGKQPSVTLGKGECARIMTGAKVPPGADCVIIIENTSPADDLHIRFTGAGTGKNICLKGEDLKKGDLVLSKGSLISPQTMSILAATGNTTVRVFKQLTAGYFCTGSELVEPENTPDEASIRNSNASQLRFQISQAGAIPVYGGIIADNRSAISEKIEEMISRHKLLIITGGVSTGDFDLIPDILEKSGFAVHFSRLRIQPGKPVLFAARNNNYVFALSGNPVSSFLQFELLVKRLIHKMYDRFSHTRNCIMIAGEDITREKTSRRLFFPVIINDQGLVIRKEFHGSAHIAALQDIFGFGILPEGISHIKNGSPIQIIPV